MQKCSCEIYKKRLVGKGFSKVNYILHTVNCTKIGALSSERFSNMSVIMYSFIPFCAGKHHRIYHGRLWSQKSCFLAEAKFCSWETSGVNWSASLAFIWDRTAKLLQLTRKGTLKQCKMSKADFCSQLPLLSLISPIW